MWLVGLPPYTPDALIDVVQEGDRVWIHFADVFAAPQRLTPEQAVALLTAGASVLALPGRGADGPLAGAWRSWPPCSASTRTRCSTSTSASAAAEVLDVLRAAVAEHRRVHLDYYSYGRDARTERDVDPYLVHAEDGACTSSATATWPGGERRFRVDRIASATAPRRPRSSRRPTAAAAGSSNPTPTTRGSCSTSTPAAAWVVEAYPVEAVDELATAALRVRWRSPAEAWLERLLVGLGPRSRVVEAPDELRDAGGARRRADPRPLPLSRP